MITNNRIIGCSDIDGTITEGFTWLPICDAFADVGFIDPGENKLIRDVRDVYTEGKLEYKDFIIDSFKLVAWALRGKRSSVAKALTEEFVSTDIPVRNWVTPTFSRIKEQGGRVILVSAAPGFIASAMGSKIGAESYSSVFGHDIDGNFTGDVDTILGATQKQLIVSHIKQMEPEADIAAFGDSEGDIGMLAEARPDLAFCINPTDGLRAFATELGLKVIDNSDKATSLI